MATLLRLALAVASGALVYCSYEPLGLWFLAIAGCAVFWIALMPWRDRPSGWLGALLGFVHGASIYVLLLPWVGEFVGAAPYLALSVALALYSIPVGAFGVLLARLRYGFVLFPLVYVAWEFLRSSFPFGGFPWVRLAWGQIEGPLRYLAPWGGTALVTTATVLVACAVVAVVASRRPAARLTALACAVVPAGLAFAAGAAAPPAGPTPEEATATVSAVQGNVPRLGLDFNAQRRAVLSNHVEQTKNLAASGADPDFVVWPENSSDVNPFADAEAAAQITEAVSAVDAPVVVGTITRDEVGARNTMVVFDPVTGAGDRHNKKYLQPFGEYMPMRDFFRLFSEYVDLAGNFKPGDGDGTVQVGDVILGVATCYEVAVDAAFRSAVDADAEILATPTNNATFGFTDMTYQQMAMSRFRAIETDRSVVVAATSGSSGIILPDGSVVEQSGIFEPALLTAELPLRSTVTPSMRFGAALEWLIVACGVAAMLWSLVRRRGGYAARENKDAPS
ncbi:apolipoprotein N-acyltransferase [Corynebacterium timonense]|uniref:Apolipoprotein N-acyltransferase n=1 Tax=Corynebacterium timonense TaxID=441500 RepID=A0A1H1P8Y3_9CORY|nr:apolipoprotein N-acyltransferase [Corynebacterium timonense]SDS07657.1 Apolipoprotein N-acyltransferase [Corynebacterium timonense]